jgi:hypothetical protein
MALLEPEEIRYASISMFALIIMTSMTAFMGLSASDWSPNQPKVPESGGYNPSNPDYWSSWQPGGEADLLSSTFFGDLIQLVTDGIAYPVAIVNGWEAMIANAGWAAGFVIVPSIVMLIVIVNAGYQIAKALPYT